MCLCECCTKYRGSGWNCNRSAHGQHDDNPFTHPSRSEELQLVIYEFPHASIRQFDISQQKRRHKKSISRNATDQKLRVSCFRIFAFCISRKFTQSLVQSMLLMRSLLYIDTLDGNGLAVRRSFDCRPISSHLVLFDGTPAA